MADGAVPRCPCCLGDRRPHHASRVCPPRFRRSSDSGNGLSRVCYVAPQSPLLREPSTAVGQVLCESVICRLILSLSVSRSLWLPSAKAPYLSFGKLHRLLGAIAKQNYDHFCFRWLISAGSSKLSNDAHSFTAPHALAITARINGFVTPQWLKS